MRRFLHLMLWGLVCLLIWPVVTIYRHVAKRPRLDNCFTWALRNWNEDHYLVIRWCRSSKTSLRWPHFLLLPIDKHEELRHFLPREEDQDYKFLPKAFFEGKIQRGDPEEDLEN